MDFNVEKYKIFDNILKNQDYLNHEIIETIGKALSLCNPYIWEKIDKILLDIIIYNEKNLKIECYKGLPEDLPSIRALIWKINFRYLPHDIKKWKDILQLKRAEYSEIKNAFILRKKEEIKIFEEIEKEKEFEKKVELIKEKENEYNKKVENENLKIDEIINNQNNQKNNINSLENLEECTDRNLLELINKDINRTHIDMSFFNSLVNKNRTMSKEEQDKMYRDKNNCTYTNYKNVYTKYRDKKDIFENELHCDVIERILYIYSKLNKDIGYVQGMNELIAPIYYCFCIDTTEKLENIEADSFWCFTLLMKDIKKLFLKENDNKKGGIFDKLYILELIISKLQGDIYKILKNNNVSIFNFAFSWINLFFSQEFLMPDTLRLWDIIFSEKDRFSFVYFFCMAILEYKKEKIKYKDFSDIITEIRDLQNENIEKIIHMAINFKNKYEKKVNEIISKYNHDEKKYMEIFSKYENSIFKAK